MKQEVKIPHHANVVLCRLRQGGALVRQSSSSEAAAMKGNGYIYFTHPDGKPVGFKAALWLIASEFIQPTGDDLFGGSQTFRVPNV